MKKLITDKIMDIIFNYKFKSCKCGISTDSPEIHDYCEAELNKYKQTFNKLYKLSSSDILAIYNKII